MINKQAGTEYKWGELRIETENTRIGVGGAGGTQLMQWSKLNARSNL